MINSQSSEYESISEEESEPIFSKKPQNPTGKYRCPELGCSFSAPLS
jgi:hypothetical protein